MKKNNTNSQEIISELDKINGMINDIISLFDSNNIEDIKKSTEQLSYFNDLCDYYKSGSMEFDEHWTDYAERFLEQEKAMNDEWSKNQKMYGDEYAYRYYSYFNRPKVTIEQDKFSMQSLPRYGYDLDNRKTYYEREINRKNYTKYSLFGVNPQLAINKISKRNLPTKIFEYLFSNGYLNEENISMYSTNQFGRTFETKRGDIQTETDMKDNQKNLHRYNKIDFSIIENSKYDKVLYISNQWDYDSLTKFIEHINSSFKGIIIVDEETKPKRF